MVNRLKNKIDSDIFKIKCGVCGKVVSIYDAIDRWCLINGKDCCVSCQRKYKVGRYLGSNKKKVSEWL